MSVPTRSSAVRLAERLVCSRAGGRIILDPLLSWGWHRYEADGETPALAYRAMRTAFHAPTSTFARVEERAAHEGPQMDFAEPTTGLVAHRHDHILEALVRDGFAVLSEPLPVAACDDLERTAREAVCTLTGSMETGRFDQEAPRARRYDVPEVDLLACATAQELLADTSLLKLAQDYLGAAPIQDLVTAWWSAPGGGSASAAAQMYHFDLDRPRFLKLFVYVTDVDAETGPHAYVRGTHRQLPAEFRFDRRYDDDEVEQRFRDDVVRIPGRRGTVFIADTRGLHKGEPVIRGHRLVFQLQWSSSLFGQTYTRPPLQPVVPALAEAMRLYPSVYRRFAVPTA
ncbi:MAG: phytanoyl-CoA dioxygenase family protein [Actinobacteria bacterium]|nr:phytanoyl-CoA dioxygenase family protein [Actinomycetota bacterium]